MLVADVYILFLLLTVVPDSSINARQENGTQPPPVKRIVKHLGIEYWMGGK